MYVVAVGAIAAAAFVASKTYLILLAALLALAGAALVNVVALRFVITKTRTSATPTTPASTRHPTVEHP